MRIQSLGETGHRCYNGANERTGNPFRGAFGDWIEMRLVCPNCDAQYEVADDAIPEAGRDVQCSNCGHAWFQRHPDVLALEEEDEEIFLDPGEAAGGGHPAAAEVAPAAVVIDAPSEPETSPNVSTAAIVEAEDAGPGAAALVDRDDEDDGAGDDEAGGREPVGAAAPRRALDETLMAVLREEAERESAARRAEAPRGIETQPELGLPVAPPAPVSPSVLAAREKFRDLSLDAPDEDAEHDDEPAARPSARRELLPDIEEINSTLRASSEPRGEGEAMVLPPVAVESGRGFRSGFTLMLIVAAALWLTYVMAPRIVTQIPASGPAMEAYVAAVDKARVGVDAALQSATRQLRSLSGEATGEGG